MQIEEDLKPIKKISLENITGDFIPEDKIVLDPHGLNILSSINKDGSFLFGPKLRDVYNIIFKLKILEFKKNK